MSKSEEKQFQEVKRKSMTGAISYFGRTIFLNVIGIVSTLILIALLSPEDFGVFGIVIQIIGILTFFSDVGLAAALIQKKDEPTRRDYTSTFTVQQILSWGIVLVCLLLMNIDAISNKIGSAGNWVLLALALSFPLASLKTIPSIILERKLDFSKVVLPQIIEQIVFNVVLIFFAWKGLGVLSYAYAVILRSLSGVITMYLIQPWKPGLDLSKQSLKLLFNFGFKFQLNDLLARIKDQFFFLYLGFTLPTNQFGYINWGKNWSLYPYNLTVQNVMAVTFPTFSRLQHNTEFLRRAIEKSLFFITLLIFPIIAAMVIFIYPVVELVPQYAKWQPALFGFVLFTLSIVWSAISTPLTNTLNAIGKINITLKLMVIWTILTWTVTPLCLRWFGFNGVAVAALLISFTSFLPIIYVKRFVPIKVWDQIWRQLLASVVLAGVGMLVIKSFELSWQTFFIASVLSALGYVLTLLVVGKEKLQTQVQPFLRLFLEKVRA